MANKTYQYWQGLPAWAKGVIAIGGLAVVYVAARGIWKKIKSKADTAKQQKTLIEQSQELKNLQNTGLRASFPDSQYKIWADKIQNQFDGIDWKQNIVDKEVPLIGYWSGSGKVVKDIFSSLKNDIDFLKLSQAYGIRTYDQAGPFTGDVTGNLEYAINDELDRGEVLGLNKILASKKIKYTV